MVTENPSSRDSGSPHKPKKVWKPKPAAEGVPSLFAHAVLSKPLKINSAATTTVKVKSKEATKTTTTTSVKSNKDSNSSNKTDEETHQPTRTFAHSSSSSIPVPAPAALQKSSVESKSKVSSKRESINSTTNTNSNSNSNRATTPSTTGTSTKGILEPSKVSSSSTTKQVGDQVKKPAPKSEEIPRKPNQSVHIIGGSSTVAGTPRSWPKPHAVPGSEKPKHRRSAGKSDKDNKDDEQFHKEIDHLIPEMYRKKSAKQLEQEQQEEIQLMRRIMWELQQLELAQQEEALRYKPISTDVDATLNVLKNAKKMNDMLDDHASVDDSDTSSKRKSAYSTHMKSKLAFFNSHHSVSHDSSDSDDSSSISSWHSDESDGLFRG